MSSLRLVSFNIGIKIPNTERVIEFLKQQNADFVAIQEMVRHVSESALPEYKVKASMDAALGGTYPHSFYAPVWASKAFRMGDKVDRDFGGIIEQGVEVMGKHPIASADNEFFYRHFEFMTDWSKWREQDHGRSLQIVEFDVDGTPLQILNLHGIWTGDKLGDERTMRQCQYVVEAAKRRDIATIIVGDFNLLPDTQSIGVISKEFRNLISEYGITSTRPDFEDMHDSGNTAIDYVFVNDKVRVGRFEVIDTDISDHLPLVLDFSLEG